MSLGWRGWLGREWRSLKDRGEMGGRKERKRGGCGGVGLEIVNRDDIVE